MHRSFTIHTVGGRYKADTPMEAAKKAAAKLFKDTKSKSLTFCIRETTKDSKKKLYHYKATRTTKGVIHVSVNKNKKIVSAYKGVGNGMYINASTIGSEIRKSLEQRQIKINGLNQQLCELFKKYKDNSKEQTIQVQNNTIFTQQDYLNDNGTFKYDYIEYHYKKSQINNSYNFEIEITSKNKQILFIFTKDNITIMPTIEIKTVLGKIKKWCDGILCRGNPEEVLDPTNNHDNQ